jgi:hypothetical protein
MVTPECYSTLRALQIWLVVIAELAGLPLTPQPVGAALRNDPLQVLV